MQLSERLGSLLQTGAEIYEAHSPRRKAGLSKVEPNILPQQRRTKQTNKVAKRFVAFEDATVPGVLETEQAARIMELEAMNLRLNQKVEQLEGGMQNQDEQMEVLQQQLAQARGQAVKAQQAIKAHLAAVAGADQSTAETNQHLREEVSELKLALNGSEQALCDKERQLDALASVIKMSIPPQAAAATAADHTACNKQIHQLSCELDMSQKQLDAAVKNCQKMALRLYASKSAE